MPGTVLYDSQPSAMCLGGARARSMRLECALKTHVSRPWRARAALTPWACLPAVRGSPAAAPRNRRSGRGTGRGTPGDVPRLITFPLISACRANAARCRGLRARAAPPMGSAWRASGRVPRDPVTAGQGTSTVTAGYGWRENRRSGGYAGVTVARGPSMPPGSAIGRPAPTSPPTPWGPGRAETGPYRATCYRAGQRVEAGSASPYQVAPFRVPAGQRR